MKPFEWELIFKSEDRITETWRAKTIGGWLEASIVSIPIQPRQ